MSRVCVLGVFVALALWRQLGTPAFLGQAPIVAALLGGFVVLVFVRRIGPRLKVWDRRLGDLSYPLYINHFAVLLPLSILGAGHRGFGLYLGGLVLSVVLAGVMFVVVEVPLRRLRDRVRGTAL